MHFPRNDCLLSHTVCTNSSSSARNFQFHYQSVLVLGVNNVTTGCLHSRETEFQPIEVRQWGEGFAIKRGGSVKERKLHRFKYECSTA